MGRDGTRLAEAGRGWAGVDRGGARVGILPERLEDALRRVRHCALSLVGEPIIYPRINAFLAELHRRRISTFMVTNAQFPKEMEQLVPCTQLYISIDAPTREQLKAVDRPLFSDFWERFNECVGLLARKRHAHALPADAPDG